MIDVSEHIERLDFLEDWVDLRVRKHFIQSDNFPIFRSNPQTMTKKEIFGIVAICIVLAVMMRWAENAHQQYPVNVAAYHIQVKKPA